MYGGEIVEEATSTTLFALSASSVHRRIDARDAADHRIARTTERHSRNCSAANGMAVGMPVPRSLPVRVGADARPSIRRCIRFGEDTRRDVISRSSRSARASSSAARRKQSERDALTEPLLRCATSERYFPITKGVFARKVGEVRAVHDVRSTSRQVKHFRSSANQAAERRLPGARYCDSIEPTSGEVRFGGRMYSHECLRDARSFAARCR